MITRKIKDGSYKDFIEGQRESSLKYYWRNREKILAYERVYRIKNPKKMKIKWRRYYHKNRDKINERKRELRMEAKIE